jgi:hypothetical protein
MLAEAASIDQAGTARQMVFDFAAPYAPPASFEQRLAWERRLLGYPLGALQASLPGFIERHTGATRVRDLESSRGAAAVVGVRLPGWHSRGYAVWDGESWTWSRANTGLATPPIWQPARFQGQWRSDHWGPGWFAIHRWEKISETA